MEKYENYQTFTLENMMTIIKSIMMKNIYVFSGMSGVGKTSIINEIAKEDSFVYPTMYTTRPVRNKINDGKLYVSEDEYEALPGKVVKFVFNNYQYAITEEEIQRANIFDLAPSGFESLKQNYCGNRKIIVIYLWVNERERIRRMKERGESEATIQQRIQYEKGEYQDVEKKVDFIVENNDFSSCITSIRMIIEKCEKLV